MNVLWADSPFEELFVNSAFRAVVFVLRSPPMIPTCGPSHAHGGPQFGSLDLGFRVAIPPPPPPPYNVSTFQQLGKNYAHAHTQTQSNSPRPSRMFILFEALASHMSAADACALPALALKVTWLPSLGEGQRCGGAGVWGGGLQWVVDSSARAGIMSRTAGISRTDEWQTPISPSPLRSCDELQTLPF